MACGGGKTATQQSELCGDDLPKQPKTARARTARRKPLETLENIKTNAAKAAKARATANAPQAARGAGVGPIAFDLIRPERGERCRTTTRSPQPARRLTIE